MMGVVIAVGDALERVWLLDTRRHQGRRTATGRWGSRHLREAGAALALRTGRTGTSSLWISSDGR